MDRIRKIKLIALAAGLFFSLSCGSAQHFVQTQTAKLARTAEAQGERLAATEAAKLQATAAAQIETMAVNAQTQVPQMAGTLSIQAQTQVPQMAGTLAINAQTQIPELLGTMSAPNGSVPFRPPASGYLGLKYKQANQNGSGQSNGIDIWASTDPMNGGQRGNPVYAVYAGKLGRTSQGLAICHPQLDALSLPALPADLVCTLYDHLADIPAQYAALHAGSCPNGLLNVNQGDLLGYMDQTDMAANGGAVHLHFVVVKQKPDNGCWTDERSIDNTLNPFPYMGLDASHYGWLSVFP